MADDLAWIDDVFGSGYDYDEAVEGFEDWKASRGGHGADRWPSYNKQYAQGKGAYGDLIRRNMGIPDVWSSMGGEISELRRVASEGLDPMEFRRNVADTTGSAMRGITDKANQGMRNVGMMYGSELSGGLMQKYQGAFEQQKVSTFGSMLGQLLQQDRSTRDSAKQHLMSLILKKAESDQMLVVAEEQRIAQLGG